MKTLIIGSVIGVLLITLAAVWISSSNKEITLRNQLIAQNKVCESYYDRMWKIISQKSQIALKNDSSFRTSVTAIMDGRKDASGLFMKWVTESNPLATFSEVSALYKDLSASVEGERAGFFMEQKKLIDINNEHHRIRQVFPNSIFIGGRADVKINIVTSSRTDETFKIGKDDDTNVFDKH